MPEISGVSGKFVQVKREPVPFQVGAKWHNQLYNAHSVADSTLTHIKAQKGKADAAQWEIYKTEGAILEDQADLIEEHFDRRIELFFLQLISCYKTPFHFEASEANSQFGKGGKVIIKDPTGGPSVKVETEAAHSSTLPCLIAYPKDKWDQFKGGDGNQPEGFVYLKHSHADTLHNATMELLKVVNRADCAIDFQGGELRKGALKIVNDAAEGNCHPCEGVKQFLRILEDQLKASMAALNPNEGRYKALKIYLDRLNEMKTDLQTNPQAFDILLGVKINETKKEQLLREVVYQKRFALIQNCQSKESQIARQILDAQNGMLKKHKKALNSVDYRLRYVLLEDPDPIFRTRMEKLFATSIHQLRAAIEQNEDRLRTFEGRTKINSFRTKYPNEIANLKRDLRASFRDLEKDELKYRADLFEGLRTRVHFWTQKEFAAFYKNEHPGDSMSPTMVSRIEHSTRLPKLGYDYKTPLAQRYKEITVEKGRRIAETFEVDPGLFLPGMITSTY